MTTKVTLNNTIGGETRQKRRLIKNFTFVFSKNFTEKQ